MMRYFVVAIFLLNLAMTALNILTAMWGMAAFNGTVAGILAIAIAYDAGLFEVFHD